MTSRQTQLYGPMIFDASDVTTLKRQIGKLQAGLQYNQSYGYAKSTLGTIIGQRFKLDTVIAAQYCAGPTCPLNVPAQTNTNYGAPAGLPPYINTSSGPAEGIGNI